jgi:hypothetical protein
MPFGKARETIRSSAIPMARRPRVLQPPAADHRLKAVLGLARVRRLGETTIATGDLAAAVTRLKQERSDGYLLAHGGVAHP